MYMYYTYVCVCIIYDQLHVVQTPGTQHLPCHPSFGWGESILFLHFRLLDVFASHVGSLETYLDASLLQVALCSNW